MGDFELEISSGAEGEYRIAARSDAGDTEGPPIRFPLDGLALEHALQAVELAIVRSAAEARRIPPERERPVQEFGAQLFRFLFQGELVGHLAAARNQAAHEGSAMRVRLRVRPPELAALPWELLYDPDRDDYLCLHAPLVRHVEVLEPRGPLAVTPPLRILGMVAQPRGLGAINADHEKQLLEKALSGLTISGRVRTSWVGGQSWQDLQGALHYGDLPDMDWHVFHFIGHGTFDERRGEGVLALAREDGTIYQLCATDLAMLLREQRSLRLVVLNACDSARASSSDAFSSIAAVLTRRGIPAVVAMQYEISDQTAITFARNLYSGIAARQPVDLAVTLARQAIKLDRPSTLEWAIPVLHLRASDATLFDLTMATPAVIVPQFPESAASAKPWTLHWLLSGRYELEELIGRGVTTDVYRARDSMLGRLVAIKALRPGLARGEAFQQRFRREARQFATLNHPSIVAIHDIGEDTATGVPVPYIVMEHVDGRTVEELLIGEPPPPLRALEIISGVLRALEYSHQRGITHGNIKPTNVMVTRNGDAKVMDFGIARAASDHTMTATNDQITGTVEYMSPEQARGHPMDARSDLYSTGCLLYALLTSRPPFGGNAPVAIANRHVNEIPIPPSQYAKRIPPEVDAIVLKVMAKSPGERYQTATEIRADVERARSGQPVAALADFPPNHSEHGEAERLDRDSFFPAAHYQGKAENFEESDRSSDTGRHRRVGPTGMELLNQQRHYDEDSGLRT